MIENMPSNETDLKEIAYLKAQIKSLKNKGRRRRTQNNVNSNSQFLEMNEEYKDTLGSSYNDSEGYRDSEREFEDNSEF